MILANWPTPEGATVLGGNGGLIASAFSALESSARR